MECFILSKRIGCFLCWLRSLGGADPASIDSVANCASWAATVSARFESLPVLMPVATGTDANAVKSWWRKKLLLWA